MNDDGEQIIITNFGKPMCILVSRLDYGTLELHKIMGKKSKEKSLTLDNVVNITELKNKINQWMHFIQKEQYPILIIKKGKPTVDLISNQDYAYLKPKIEYEEIESCQR